MFNKYFGGGLKNDKDEYMIEANILGFLSASYQLGSILGVPIAPWMNQRFGRRWCIMAGSWIMVVGAIVQGMAQHSRPSPPRPALQSCTPDADPRSQSPCTSSLASCSASASSSASSRVPP